MDSLLRCAELENELNAMRKEFQKNNVEVDHELSNDLADIMTKAGSKVTPFMNLFLAAAAETVW